MKKTSEVIAAEAALEAKESEVRAAEQAVLRLRREHREALAALRDARTRADAELPQCRLVRIGWRSRDERESQPAAILRKTPTGMLVVRRFGDATGHELRFKPSKFTGVFREIKTGSLSDHYELRDVPAEYLPGAHSTAAKEQW